MMYTEYKQYNDKNRCVKYKLVAIAQGKLKLFDLSDLLPLCGYNPTIIKNMVIEKGFRTLTPQDLRAIKLFPKCSTTCPYTDGMFHLTAEQIEFIVSERITTTGIIDLWHLRQSFGEIDDLL